MMKIRLSAFVAAVLLGAPLASHAEPPHLLSQNTQAAHMSDGGALATRKNATEMPHMAVERLHAAVASSLVDSHTARDWWKDN